MFDLDASKIIIVGVAALIFIPPKDLPRVMRQVGQFVGKRRRMATEFQGQFMDAMREADMADLRKEAQKLSDAARIETGLENTHLGHTGLGTTGLGTADHGPLHDFDQPALPPAASVPPVAPSGSGSDHPPVTAAATTSLGTEHVKPEPEPQHTA